MLIFTAVTITCVYVLTDWLQESTGLIMTVINHKLTAMNWNESPPPLPPTPKTGKLRQKVKNNSG